MSRQYKLIVWGPGHVGGTALKEALGRPEFDVVGAKVWSAEKDGRDIGELVGVDAVGVSATTDIEALLALEADCVLHTPLPLDQDANDLDVIRLLESGKNVVSTAGFHYPARRGKDYEQRLSEACRRGGSTLRGTGIHPSFAVERLTMTLTGMMSEIDHIRVVEGIDAAPALTEMTPMFGQAIGFGNSMDDVGTNSLGFLMVDPYYKDSVAFVGSRLYGVDPTEIRFESEYAALAAPHDIDLKSFVVEQGTAATLTLTKKAYIGDHHFFTLEECWYLGGENRYVGAAAEPFGPFSGDVHYIVEIEGRPTRLSVQLDLTSTTDLPTVTCGSVTSLLQWVVPVCEADPGILYESVTPYCTTDYRNLVR